MAFVISEKRRQRSPSDVSRISVHKNGVATPPYSLNIYVCLDHVSAMGWAIGDRINVFFDDQDPLLVMLKRTPIQGSVLSKGKSENTQGKTLGGGLKVRWLPTMSYKYGDVITSISHQVKGDALIIQFQKVKRDMDA